MRPPYRRESLTWISACRCCVAGHSRLARPRKSLPPAARFALSVTSKIRNAKNPICLLAFARGRHQKGYSTNLHIWHSGQGCHWPLAAHGLCLSVIPCTLPPLSQQSQNHVTSKNAYSPSAVAPFGQDLAAVRLLQIVDILATHPSRCRSNVAIVIWQVTESDK